MSRFAERRSTRIHYEITSGPEGAGWFVLVPGLASSTRSFPELVERLSQRFHVLCFDPRGAGKTVSDTLRFTLPDIADDLNEVMNVESIESAHVLGISMGGMIAQEFVLAYPERVKRLMLAVTTCGGRPGVRPSPATIGRLVRAVTGVPLARSYDDVVRLFGDLLFGPALGKDDRIRFFQTRRHARPAPPHMTIAQMLAVRKFSSHSRLHTVRTPTLVLGAIHDQLMPPVNSDILFAAIPGAELVKLNAGHCSFFERVDEFMDHVTAFTAST